MNVCACNIVDITTFLFVSSISVFSIIFVMDLYNVSVSVNNYSGAISYYRLHGSKNVYITYMIYIIMYLCYECTNKICK